MLYERFLYQATVEMKEMDPFMIMSMLRRRVQDLEGALKDALKSFEMNPYSNQATFVGLCYKEMRDIENAAIYFEKGYELDPTNISGFLEMGDLLLDETQFERAGEYYKRALEVEPENDWALPSLYFCQYATSKDEEAKARLLEYKKQYPNNGRTDYLIGYVEYLERVPYEDYIPVSGEATINLVHQLEEQQTKGQLKFSLSALESGSAINTLRLYLGDYDEHAKLEVLYAENAIMPDISPISETGIIFWKYDEQYQQTPAVNKPSHKVEEVVTQLACMKYSCKEWYQVAGELAKNLEESDLQDLYSIMVYPPKPEFEIGTDIWLMRIQYAAVFLIAHMEYTMVPAKKLFGIGFGKSKQVVMPSKSILDICYGQLDWPIIPAMVVLAYQAQIYPECQERVKEVFLKIMKRVNRESYCFFEEAFLVNFLRLPNLGEPEREALNQWKQELK